MPHDCRSLISSALAAATLMGGASALRAQSITDDVNPMIGTAEHGHTFPGATVPFGMIQLSPDTRDATWDGCSGYHYSDTTILGFSHNHLSGTGCGDLGNILLMPIVGDAALEPRDAYKATFSHRDEVAQPGYYSVLLRDSHLKVELTATARVGMHRYTFPANSHPHVILDLWHGVNNNPLDAQATVENDHTITGYRRSNGWGGEKTFYYVIEFSKPFSSFGLAADRKATDEKNAKAARVKGHFDFADAGANGEEVLVKVALSTVSVEGAKKNLEAECTGWDFDGVHHAAVEAWEKSLGSMQATIPDTQLRQTYYTALYHTMMAPTILSDIDGQVRGPDGKVHQTGGFTYYTELSLWDTFRAQNPLMTLTNPARVNDVVETMMAHDVWFGHKTLPIWPNGGRETYCMIGNHAIPVIVNAFQNGFQGWDKEKALQEMIETTDEKYNFQGEYAKLGYVPSAGPESKKKEQRQAASRTLEYAYDDACISRFAQMLGKTDIAAKYAKRADNWKNIFDQSSGFMRGKLENGSWVQGPKDWENWIDFDNYTEANAWQYTFFVPQNIPGLIQAMGGDEAFVAKLNACFNSKAAIPDPLSDVTGLIGMYAHGNEPCHHMAYLYNYAGQPWRTQETMRRVATTLYDNSVGGICGNDDCGQMSAWYVFTALGFYPVDPTSGVYVIGSPLVDKAAISLDPKYFPHANGGTFTVIAENNSPTNKYIQSATLNGKTLTRSWLKFSEVTSGGELHLVMGGTPNKTWGTAAADRPAIVAD